MKPYILMALGLLMACHAHYVTVDTGADLNTDIYPYAGISYASSHPCSLSVGWWLDAKDTQTHGPYAGFGCSWTIFSREGK